MERAVANGEYVLEMSEHKSRSCALPPDQAFSILDEAYELLSPAIAVGLLSVETRRLSGGQSRIVLATTSVVGFISCGMPNGPRVFIRVNPKVGTARMLELAVLAGMMPNWQQGGAQLTESLENALLEWMIGAFDHSLRILLAHGGLRNTHERLRANLVNKVRGRLLISPWLRNVARGQPHVVPCEFPSLEFDNQVNRFLRWAIHVGIAGVRTIPHASDIARRLEKSDRHFAGAALIKPARPLPDPHALPTNLRHYAQAVGLARLVIDSIHVGTNAGQIEGTSISLDMNKVYERAFFNGLRSVHGAVSEQENWSVKFATPVSADDSASLSKLTTMIPDVWVSGDHGRLPIVIDTKWKKVFGKAQEPDDGKDLLSESETATVRLRPEDLYQATAYAIEAIHRLAVENQAVEGCLAVLVYPSTKNIPDLSRDIKVGDVRILIRLVGWNVNMPAAAEIGAIWSRLSDAAKTVEPSGPLGDSQIVA